MWSAYLFHFLPSFLSFFSFFLPFFLLFFLSSFSCSCSFYSFFLLIFLLLSYVVFFPNFSNCVISWILISYLLLIRWAERAQRAENRKNTCKLRKQLPQFYNTHTSNAHNTTKKRNRKKHMQIKKIIFVLTTHASNAHNTTKKETCCK